MKKHRRLFAFVLATVLCFGLAACGGTQETPAANTADPAPSSGEEETASDLQVGIYFPTSEESRWERDAAALQKLMDETDYTYSLLWGDGTPETEKTIVETFVTQGVEVLVLAPCDTEAAVSTAEYAHDAGVAVISYDRIVQNTEGIDYVVSFSSYDVGKTQAEFFIAEAGKEGRTGIPLYVYSGNTTDANAYDFFGGFWDTVQPYIVDGTFVLANNQVAQEYIGQTDLDHDTLYSIMKVVDTQWDANVAKTLAETDLISADASLKGEVYVLAPNDDTCRGIMSAFENDAEIKSFRIVGQDANEVNVQMIIDGEQAMTVWKDTTTLAGGAFKVIDAVLKGDDSGLTDTWDNGAVEVPATVIPVTAVTTENVKDTIFAAGYYNETDFDFSNWKAG